MAAVGGYPMVTPRSRGGLSHSEESTGGIWRVNKKKLVDQFRNFESTVVEHEHIKLAKELIEKHRGEKWYEWVLLDEILEQNGVQENKDQLLMLASGFDYLIKYAVNMLKPVPHPQWRAITTSRETFRTSIDCMKGARDILKKMGYTRETSSTIEIEAGILEPDRNKVAAVTAELLMCKLEVEHLHQNTHNIVYHKHSDKDRYHDEDEFHDARDSFEATDDRHNSKLAVYSRVDPQHSYHQPMFRAGSSSSSSSKGSDLGGISGSRTAFVVGDRQEIKPLAQQPQQQWGREGADHHGSGHVSNGRSFDEHLRLGGGVTSDYRGNSSPHMSDAGDGRMPYNTSSREAMSTNNNQVSSEWNSKDEGLRFGSDRHKVGHSRNDLNMGIDNKQTLDGRSVVSPTSPPVAPPRRGISTNSDVSLGYSSMAPGGNGALRSSSGDFIQPAQSIHSSASGDVSNVYPSVSSPGLQGSGTSTMSTTAGGPIGRVVPVPVPRKRRSKTSMVSLNSSNSSISSSAETTPSAEISSNTLPRNSFPSMPPVTEPSMSSATSSSSVQVSTAGSTGMAQSTSTSSSSTLSVFEQIKKNLADVCKQREKRVENLNSGPQPATDMSTGGDALDSMSSRRIQTYHHSLQNSDNSTSLRQKTTRSSSADTDSPSHIKYPPANRRSISFKDDCIDEEDISLHFKEGDADNRESRRIFPVKKSSPGNTPPGSQHSTPRETRTHSGEHRSYSGEHRPNSGEHRSYSGEQHSLYGEHRSLSGEQNVHTRKAASISRESHSGEQGMNNSVEQGAYYEDVHSSTSEQHSRAKDRHPNSGDQHPNSGDQRPNSGDQRPNSRDQRPNSRDQRPNSGDQLRRNSEGSQRNSGEQKHRLPSDPSAANNFGQPIPANPQRPELSPLISRTDSKQWFCHECKKMLPPADNFCNKCGARSPFSPTGADLRNDSSSRGNLARSTPTRASANDIPMRASVKETKQVEKRHFTQFHQLDEEVKSKETNVPLELYDDDEDSRSKGGERKRGRVSDMYGSDGFDYGSRGRVEEREKLPAKPIAWAGNDREGDYYASGLKGDGIASPLAEDSLPSLGDNIMQKVESDLEAIKRKEKEEKEKARLAHERKKAMQERAKMEKEKPEMRDVPSRGATGGGARNVGQDGKRQMNRTKGESPAHYLPREVGRGHGSGASLVDNEEISMVLEQDLKSIQQTDEEYKRLKEIKRREYEEKVRRREEEQTREEARRRKVREESDKKTSAMNLERDGKDLLECIKECVPHNYSLGEVHQAYHEAQGQSVLRYLKSDWARKVSHVCKQVGNRHRIGKRKLGMPMEKEARDMLVQTKGDMEEACSNIARNREKKILELLDLMNGLRHRDPSLPPLEWDTAADALSRNGMDVMATLYVIQADWLEPLYEFIFSEMKDVEQTYNENIKKIIVNKEDKEKYSMKARKRLIMSEFKFREEAKAQMVLDLIDLVEAEDDQNNPLHHYIQAMRDFNSVDDALAFLSKECPVCMAHYSIHEMLSLPGCSDSICKECFKFHFSNVVNTMEVKHYNCPVCKLPNMADREAAGGMYVMILSAMAKEYLEREDYERMQSRLTEYNLMTQPNFIWCASCPNGFMFDVDGQVVPREIPCPSCEKKMCHKCRKPWEAAHDGISCEKFAQWKQDNDPDAQKQGLAAHLNANGIECPACHMRYDLARGGCMHFICTRCPNEFCSGCGQSMKKGMQCGKFESCKTKGLHAHHPRDCLFYLRDFDVKELQDFLRDNNVEFDEEAPKEQVEAAKAKMEEEGKKGEEGKKEKGGKKEEKKKDDKVKLHCRVMLQKETPQGLRDEECGTEAPEGHAGLCMIHYKEYLVDKINKNKLDPITMYPIHKIKLMLGREEMPVPEINDENDLEDETEEQYNARLINHVKRVLPLLRHNQGEDEPDRAEEPLAVLDIEVEEEDEED